MTPRLALAALASLALTLSVPALADDTPPSAPRWYKGNLHTHTLWSDGNDFPEMIVDWYAKRDYDFLALSDHNVLSQGQRWMNVADANRRAGSDSLARYTARFGKDWVETRDQNGKPQVRLKPLGEFRTWFEKPGRFLLIQGEEISDSFEKKPIHMNATNLLEAIKPQGGKSVADAMANNLKAAEEQAKRLGRPILTHLNHPNFGYAITAEELAMVTREHFFEVYNGHPATHHRGDDTHASVERMWDIINTLRIGEMRVGPVCGLANDDSHEYFKNTGSTPGRGWVMVRARFLTPESVIHAFEAGDFYASNGVTLKEIKFDAATRKLTVEIEPREGATFRTLFVGTRKGYDPTRKPVTDKDGKPLPVTQRYSDDVGKTFASAEGLTASYTLHDDDLYVRAVVTSSEAPENPSFEGQKAEAWTQPVGWERWMAKPDAKGETAKP